MGDSHTSPLPPVTCTGRTSSIGTSNPATSSSMPADTPLLRTLALPQGVRRSGALSPQIFSRMLVMFTFSHKKAQVIFFQGNFCIMLFVAFCSGIILKGCFFFKKKTRFNLFFFKKKSNIRSCLRTYVFIYLSRTFNGRFEGGYHIFFCKYMTIEIQQKPRAI